VRHRIELYEKGAGVGGRWLALVGNDNVATQPCEVERAIIDDGVLVFYHLEEGAGGLIRNAAECARRVRDNVDVFWIGSRPKSRGPIEDIISNVAKVIDCVDLIVVLIGYQDLPAELTGPEAHWHYSWSFRVCGSGMLCVGRACEEGDIWSSCKVVHRPDGAVLARYDHFVLKCALFVERNRAVVREGAPDLRKGRDGTQQKIILIDVLAFCDVNVARGEPGRDGLPWRDSQVFFNALLIPKRNLSHHRPNPQAVERSEILIAPFGRVQIRWGSGHTCGFEV
jgi:hypothetical protein